MLWEETKSLLGLIAEIYCLRRSSWRSTALNQRLVVPCRREDTHPEGWVYFVSVPSRDETQKNGRGGCGNVGGGRELERDVI